MNAENAPPNHPCSREIPEEILDALHRYKWQVRLARLLRGAGVTLTVTAVLLGAALCADRFFYLEPGHRFLITWGTVAALAITALAAAGRLLRPLGTFRLALGMEASCPELEERLITTLEVLRAGAVPAGGPALIENLVSSTAEELADLAVGRFVRWRSALCRLAAGAAAALLLAALFASDPEAHSLLLARFLHPSGELPRPSDVLLAVLPGNGVAARGEDLVISASVLRGEPARVQVFIDRGGGLQPFEMEREGAGAGAGAELRLAVPSLRSSLTYHVVASQFRSPTYKVEARDRPEASGFEVVYNYPSYTGLAPRRAAAPSGRISAVAGTVAHLEVRCSRPVASARLQVSGEDPEKLEPQGDLVRARIAIRRAGSYRLWLEDADRISNLWGEVHAIDAVPDRPPHVRVTDPPESIVVERTTPVEVKYDVSDDYGVHELEARIERGGGNVLQLKVPPGDVSPDPDGGVVCAGALRLDLAQLGLEPGERVEYRVAATDQLEQVGLSAPRSIELAMAPPPPEGSGWLARLDAIAVTLAKTSAAAGAIAAEAAHGGEPLPIDEALADRLSSRSQELEETRLRLARVGDESRAVARRIAFPSVNRGALEGLARRLHATAEGSLGDFAGEILRATGAIREAIRARADQKGEVQAPASVPVDALAAHGRAFAEDLAFSTALFAAVHREERLEAAVDGLVELGAAVRGLAQHLDPVKKDSRALVRALWGNLRDRGNAISDELKEPGRPGNTEAPAALEASRALRDGLLGVSGRIEAALGAVGVEDAAKEVAAAAGVVEAGEKSGRTLLAEASKVAAAARARLECDPDLPALAAAVAEQAEAFAKRAKEGKEQPAMDSLGAALKGLRGLRWEIRWEMKRAEDRDVPDFETSTLLLEIDDVLDGAERELVAAVALAAGLGPLQGEARAARLAEIARAAEAALAVLSEAAPAFRDLDFDHRASALLARLETAARAQELTAAQAAATPRDQARSLRALAAREAEIARELESLDAAARATAERFKAEHPEATGKLLAALEPAAGAPARSGEALSLLRDGKNAEGAMRMSAVASGLTEASSRIGSLRAGGLPHRERVRAWVLKRRGTLPGRIAALAGRQGKLAEATSKTDPAARKELERWAGDQEELERDAREVARSASREADRLSFARAASETVAARLSARARDLDNVARSLSRIASGDMRDARSALSHAAGLEGDERDASLQLAAVKQEAAQKALADLSEGLRAVDGHEAAGEAAERLEGLAAQAAAAGGPGEQVSVDQVRAQAAALHGAVLALLEHVSARLPAGPFKSEVVALLTSASEELHKASEAATAGNAGLGSQHVAAGRGHLDRAIELLRAARRGAEEKEALARQDLAPDEEKQESSRELQETYAELDRLRALRAWQGEVTADLEKLLAEIRSGPDKGAGKDKLAEELARKQEKLAEELEGRTLSRAKLVALVADLLRLTRRAREIAEEGRSILTALGAAANVPPDALGERQDAETRAGEEVLDGIRKAGAGITIHLPSVLKAYWDADAHVDPAAAALKEASSALAQGAVAPAMEAARKGVVELSILADLLDIVRQRALEEIARTEDESQRFQLERQGMDEALEVLREGARLLRAGDLDAAANRARQGARSLDAAAGELRLSLAGREVFDMEEGFLSSRLLAPGRVETALAWKVAYRGEELTPSEDRGASGPGGAGGAGLQGGAGFPEEFRELVRIYLKALTELKE